MAPPTTLLRGGGIPPSTLSYVLGLVRRSYLPPARTLYLSAPTTHPLPHRTSDRWDAGSKVSSLPTFPRTHRTKSQTFNRSHLSSSSSSSLPSSRHASSAHAVLEYDPPPEYHSPPRPRVLPPVNHPLQHSLPSLPLALPRALTRLRPRSTSAGVLRSLFESSKCTHLHFASSQLLSDVTLVFLRTGEPSTWAWLSGQLGHLISDLASAAPAWSEVREAAKALRSYALAELDQWEYARRELAGTDNVHYGSLGFKHGLRALLFARTGNWDAARAEIGRSVSRWTSTESRAYNALDMEMLRRYLDVLRGADRLEEVFEILGNKRVQDRIRRPANEELIDLVYSALADLEDPAGSLSRLVRHRTTAQGRMIAAPLINALLRRRRLDDAVDVIRSSIGAGLQFSPTEMGHFGNALQAAGRGNDLKELSVALPDTLKDRFDLLQRLQHASDMRRSEDLEAAWTELAAKHSPTRTETLVYARGLAALGRADDTRTALLPLFGDSLERNLTALTIMHTAYCAAHDIDGSCQYLDKLLSIRPKVSDFNRTLAVIASHADVPFTVELFDSMKEHGLKPDRASFTTLISLFANRRDQENAQNVFDAMREAGHEPDQIAWAALLNAYVEAGDWEGAAARFDGLPAEVKADASVATTVLKALVLLASPTDRIMRIFRSIRSPSKYVWALAIQSVADNGDLVRTRDLYEEMEAASVTSHNAPKPGVHIYSILLHAYLRAGYNESAREVYDEMLRQGIVPTSVTYGMVIASFSRLSESRSMVQAQAFADDIYRQSKRQKALEAARSRGTIEENLFGPLLEASAKEGNVEEAIAYFSQASTSNTSIPTYSKLMDAYRRAGNADSVLEIWKKVLEYGIKQTSQRITSATSFIRSKPNDNMLCIPLSITLDALSAAGRYFDVKKVWADTQAAGFGYDSQNYNHYAIALARTGDIESAFSVVDSVILPKWYEIHNRRVSALRESKASRAAHASATSPSELDGSSDDLSQALISPGIAVPPAFRPPNRRDEQRWNDGDPTGGSASSEGSLAMLEKWRPSDVLWRPSHLTISVLEHAYRQLEEAKRRTIWMALPGDREDEASEGLDGVGGGEHQITFPSFNNAPLRDQHGQPRKESAGMVLVKLNRRYLRVVSLITLHRKKQRAREVLERRTVR